MSDHRPTRVSSDPVTSEPHPHVLDPDVVLDGWVPPGRAHRPLVLSRKAQSITALAFFVLVSAALVTIGIVLDARLLEQGPPSIDVRVLEAIGERRTGTMVTLARVVTTLGDLWLVTLVGAVLAALARRRSGHWDSASLVGAIVGGGVVITGVVKELTDRARPDGALVEALSFAFPSGHSARAAAVYGLIAFLSLRWGRTRLSRISVSVLAVLMAVATGLSRLVLEVHWPTDVLAGWALGAIWMTVVLVVTRPYLHVQAPTY